VPRILLTGRYEGDRRRQPASTEESLLESMRAGSLNADEQVARYCCMLYERNPSYSEVASRAGLDRRTVRKHAQRYAAP
jgi:AraC-like DNA-binding protein